MAQRDTQYLRPEIPPMGWLVVISGPRTGTDFRLQSVTNIGRDGTINDVILDDDKVSAEHARIKLEGGQFVLYDLASKNGTWVNGERIQRRPLLDDDELKIGEASLVFKQVKVKT